MEKERRTSKLFGSRISSIFNPNSNPNASELRSLVNYSRATKSPPPQPLAASEPVTPNRASTASQVPGRDTLGGVSPSPLPLAQPLLNIGANNRYSLQSHVTSSTGVSSDASMSVLRPMVDIPDYLLPRSPASPRLSRKPPPSMAMYIEEELEHGSPHHLDRINLLESIDDDRAALADMDLQHHAPNFLKTPGREASNKGLCLPHNYAENGPSERLHRPLPPHDEFVDNGVVKIATQSPGIPKSVGIAAGLEDIINSISGFDLESSDEDNIHFGDERGYSHGDEPIVPLRLHRRDASEPAASRSLHESDLAQEETETEVERELDNEFENGSDDESDADYLGMRNEDIGSGHSRNQSLNFNQKHIHDFHHNQTNDDGLSEHSQAGRNPFILGSSSDNVNTSSEELSAHQRSSISSGSVFASVPAPYPLSNVPSLSSIVFPKPQIPSHLSQVSQNPQNPQTSQNSLPLTDSSSMNSPASMAFPFASISKTPTSTSTSSGVLKRQPDVFASPGSLPRSTAPLSAALGAKAGHRKSNSISSILSSNSYRNVNLLALKKTLNLQPGEGERSNYVYNIRKAAGTSYNESQPGLWKLPIGILPVDKNANYGLSNGRYLRMTGGVTQGRSKKASGVELKHGHLAPRLLAAEVDDNDTTIPGLGSRLGRSGVNNLFQSLRFQQNQAVADVKSSNSSITAPGSGSQSALAHTPTTTSGFDSLKRVTTENSLTNDVQSIVTGGDSALSRTKSNSSGSLASISEAKGGYYQHPGYNEDNYDTESKNDRAGDEYEEELYDGFTEDDYIENNINGEAESNYYDDERPRLVLANPDYSESDEE